MLSRASIVTVLWSYFIQLVILIALERGKKECNMIEIILEQGFCKLKIKITLFQSYHLPHQVSAHDLFLELVEILHPPQGSKKFISNICQVRNH